MSALRSSHPAQQQIADALAWLRAHAQPGAHLHADTRKIAAGDAFLAYAVDGADNRPFIANAIDWLAQDEALIRIRSKDRTPPNLVFESDMTRNILKWGNLVGVPLLFALFGLVRVTGRRRRAESRWREVVS